MLKTLAPGAIGIRGLSLAEQVDLARRTGWPGLMLDVGQAAELGAAATRDLLARAGVRLGNWGLPFAWNRDEETWRRGLADLPRLAAVAAELGCTRVTTWMPSGSNERPYDENLAWHVERFRPIAEVLKGHGHRLGIEFIGPKSFRAQFAHEFAYDLGGLLRVRDAIGTGNVGVLLDAWHLWHTGTPADVARLTAEDVVLVHVMDAPPGDTPREELPDTVRALPLETGRIDLAAFMRALRAIGYDGPVSPEPFSQRLNDLGARDPDAAARETLEAMDRLWRAAGPG